MTDTNEETIMNDDTLIAIYDNIAYIWKDNSWQEVEVELLNTGDEND